MTSEIKIMLNSQHGNKTSLSRKLKAVIGYWTDYFSGKYEDSVSFVLFGEKVVVKDLDDTHYTIFYKWLKFDVHYLYIFETLDFIENTSKAMHNIEDSDYE